MFADFGGVSHAAGGLRLRAQRARLGQRRERLHDCVRTGLHQPLMQGGGAIVRQNRHCFTQQHRAGVEAFFHAHDADAALVIASLNRALDRGGTAPARQQRGVNIEAAERRNIEHRARQNQAVGGHHHDIVRGAAQAFDGGGIVFEGGRLKHLDAACQRDALDGAGHQFQAAPGRAVRLG